MSEIFWIRGNPPAPLAIVTCPAGPRRLKDELFRIRQGGVETLVSLLQAEEADWLGLAEESALAQRAGLRFLSYPIPDTHVPPNLATFRAFVSNLADRLRVGEHIGIHCRGSIGRATVTAACALIHLDWQPETALAAIQAARGLAVPDTREQQEWILAFEAEP